MTSPAPRPETIEKLANGVYPAFAMLAGMQLDLFTPLKDGPMYAAQLADTLGVGSAKLQPLLYALVVAGLLTVDGERFANTPEANDFLVRGSPTYLGGMQGNFARQWNGTLKTAESIRTGTAQDKIDFSAMSSEAGEAFFRQLHAGALTTGRELVARYDFSSYRTLLDVGGGSGGLAIALTEACPHLHATVVDLPTVTPITQRFVAEAGAAARVQVIPADVVQGPLTGAYEVAVLRAFIQVLSPEQARRALRHISQVIEPGGAIYIIGNAILDNTRTAPFAAVAFSLYLINALDGGQSYTEQEHRNWLTEAGFVGCERATLPNGWGIVSAQKSA
jgi:ubiquinone/menaquinone biosynthesis C-methylase UbiE